MRKRLIGTVAALAALGALALTAPKAPAQETRNQARIGDLTIRQGEIPRRVVGYGLVVGLDGTGDRSFGGNADGSPTVRSVVNLLRRFDVLVPSERLRLRDVAAVLVTAEVSPYLRAGGRFDVTVSALGDASSLQNGTLWITPLLTDPGTPPVATAQGAIRVADLTGRSLYARRGNSGTILRGGILEVDPPPTIAGTTPRLLLKDPDLGIASRIAGTINASVGAGTATVEDPGSISLAPRDPSGDLVAFMAGIDTLEVRFQPPARIVISEREGTVVAGGDIHVGAAVVHHRGITLQIGGISKTTAPPQEGETPAAPSPPGLLQMPPEASVQDVAAGLSTAGATPDETVAIFEALCAAGALHAEVVVR